MTAQRIQIEKDINAAEKAYSDAQEAHVRAYKKLGTVTEDTGRKRCWLSHLKRSAT